MPTLPLPFTASVGDTPVAGGRRASPEDFAGADFSGLGKTVRGAIDTFVSDTEDKESRAALVASTEIRAKYAKALDDAAISGAPLEPIKEAMNADLAKIGEGFQTKRGADTLSVYQSNANLMFNEQANAVQVRRAAAVARVEGSKFLNSVGAIIQRNPAYLPFAEKDAEAFGQTLSGISPEQRAEIVNGLKQEINQSAAIAMTRIDPEGAKKKLEAGEWNLTPDQRSVAINKAESEIRAKQAEERLRKQEERIERQERDEKAYDSHLKLLLDNKGGKSWRRAVMDDANLEPRTREHLILLAERRAKELAGEEKKSDPTALRDLYTSILKGDFYNNDPIVAAVQSGRVNVRDAAFLSSVQMQQKDENGRSIGSKMNSLFSNFGRALTQDPQFIGQPGVVAEIQMDYQARVSQKMSALRDAKQDPNVVFDPRSKEYVGSAEFMNESVKAVRARAAGQGQQIGAPRIKTDSDLLALQPGDTFVDPTGTARVYTEGMKKRLLEEQAAVKKTQDWSDFLMETGGTLQPGENQMQAFDRWKAKRGR